MGAYRAYPQKKFWDYAILGEDIVIADELVAKCYSEIMSEAHAVISKEKTLVSHREFAKKFFRLARRLIYHLSRSLV